MTRLRVRSVLLGLAAPALALLLALVVATVVVVVSGSSPFDAVDAVARSAGLARIQTATVNTAITYYLSAVAVAVGFRMNLFNIGVDGQYRVAAMLAAAAGAAWALPPVVHQVVIIAVAVAAGAAWSGIAALLKVTRGVSEVISTIMLNAIATALVAWLILPAQFGLRTKGSNDLTTTPIGTSGRVPSFPPIPGPGSSQGIYGLILLAAVVGLGYWFLLGFTRFGFDLRATGSSASAAVASGVSVRRMVVVSMLISGGVAGLVGLPVLLGSSYSYGLDFPTGIGFTGIAVALLGRNHPVGMVFGALLWSFLERTSNGLQAVGISTEIVTIVQGVIVISVVVAYELVRRYKLVLQQREVGKVAATIPGAAVQQAEAGA
ncbi:MAG: ABC transporter permease [Mycobacteriaceae bacterium]